MSTGHGPALIIGGGIAGPVVAMALQRIGIESTVYEAYDTEAWDAGAFLTVASNGLDALRAIDAHGPIVAAGFPTRQMSIWSGTGRRLGGFESGMSDAAGIATTTLRRSALYAGLRGEATRRGIPFVHGKRLVGADSGPDEVKARFADGSEATGRMLIGADGIWSTTRTIVAPGAPTPQYAGLVGTGGYSYGVDIPAEPDTFQFVYGKQAFFGYIAREGGEVWWFANLPMRPEPSRDALAAGSPADWKQRMLDLFGDDVMPLRAILEKNEGDVFPLTAMHTLEPAPSWHRGRMVLVGDAAHATSPSSGQGASLALEDAIELARCLRDRDDATAAFTTYQRLREDRVARILRDAKRVNADKAAGPVGRRIRDALMPYMLRWFVKPDAQAWIYSHHIDFEKPVAA